MADDLRRGVVAFEPGTDREDPLYAQALTPVGNDRCLHPRAGLILYTIHDALDYPFDGLVRVGPDAFEAAPTKLEAYGGR